VSWKFRRKGKERKGKEGGKGKWEGRQLLEAS